MFYESKNSVEADLLKVESGVDFSFPSHLHNSFEVILVAEGEMTVTVENKVYTLNPDTALLIFPNQIHSLHTSTHSRHCLCIFSPHYVQAFRSVFNQSVPLDNRFQLRLFPKDSIELLQSNEDLLLTKGLLYLLCSDFDRTASYTKRTSASNELLLKIFDFVDKNYHTDCSLTALSAYISYSPVYLSRFFKQWVNISFTEYVTRFRINEAAYRIKNSQGKLLSIAYDCGFSSLRSFNRCFKAIMNTTPSKYRSLIG
ncbi:MAG: AraC family transcriptional regulator [Ruminococcaceae bacterium]|nr:AraC family transcriptional regulator [Oscillospiraceae bacterium]